MQRYQEKLEESVRESEFIFDSVDALCYDFNKITLSRGESYIDSPEWLKNKNATINPKNNEDKCFQYALTVALNHEQIKKNLKEYQILSPLLINTIEKTLILQHALIYGKFLKEINQFLLIFCMCLIILKK